jgi:hypothetical protein
MIGRGDVTYAGSIIRSENTGKPTFYHRRFKSPFFLWLTQILKAVAVIVVAAITLF